MQEISGFASYMLILLVGTGVFLTFRLRFLPIRKLGYAIKLAFSKKHKNKKQAGDISAFQALMTSLAATIGTANIAGVATAIAIGGPGAVFWMWITAVFGMATKFSECVLAVKYREKGENGSMRGGPMYALEKGLGAKRLGRFLAVLFCVFTITASFGIGNMAQANSVSGAAKAAFGLDPLAVGIMLSVMCGLVILGGIKTIAKFASKVVPLMGGLYILAGLIVIALNADKIGEGLANIFRAAFSGQAATGAFAGASTIAAMRYGVARGVFSNEAGLGSAPIAAAAAKTDHPVRQGLVSMTGTFFDTLIICTITALVIACTGTWEQADAMGNALTGAPLTIAAFCAGLSDIGGYVVTIGLMLFAFTSILGWSYYGEKSLEYLVRSERAAIIYRVLFCIVVIVGAVFPLEFVWNFADTANVLMAVPNLICLLALSGVVVRETDDYRRNMYKNQGKTTKK